MSGMFRPTLRFVQTVQSPLGVLSATAAGGAILPAHVPSSNAFAAPVLRLSAAVAAFTNAPTFGAASVRVTLQPVAVAGGGTIFAPVVGSSFVIAPSALASGQSFYAPLVPLALKPAAFGNQQSFHAAQALRGVGSAAFGNAASFFGPVLSLRLAAPAGESAGVVFGPGVAQAGLKNAPLTVSGGAVFAPRVESPHTFEVVGTLNVAGWTPRAPARRARPHAWPNLPKVEAPPWRLVVVTPEIARERARALLAARRRNDREKRKRDMERRLARSFDVMIDDQVARTVVCLVAEDGAS